MTSLTAMRAQRQPIPLPTTLFTGQTVIVTGSNTGLGLEAARHIVRLDAARVILAVRSLAKGEAAKTSIEQSTGRKDVVDVWLLDMASAKSVQAFAARCESLPRLDVLIANAGVLRNTFEEAEGTDVTITVNVINTLLLILNLLPTLRRSGAQTGTPSRAVITSSVLHEEAKFQERLEPSIFEAFKKHDGTFLADRYNTSKLLEVFLVRSVAEAMKEGSHANEPVILNCVNPGLCHSELDKNLKGLVGHIFSIIKSLMARTTEVGGRTLVHSAAAGLESHGQYMTEIKVREPGKFVTSKEGITTQERVHKELMEILERIQPGVTKNI